MDLLSLESCQSISEILDGIELDDFQCVDVLKVLYYKKAMVSYDTGLGKTLIAAAVMRALINEVPSRKFIFIGENGQVEQTPSKIRKHADLRVMAVTGEQEVIEGLLHSRNLDKIQVLFLTYQALNNFTLMRFLYLIKDQFCGIFLDEAQQLSNFENSSSALMARAMLRNFEYRVALTATPVTTRFEQMANLMHMLDWNRFNNVKSLTRDLEDRRHDLGRERHFVLNRTRRDLGIIVNYNTHLEMVEPHKHQAHQYGGNILKLCKGEGAVNQATKLVDLIKLNKGKKGLVFVNQHSVRDWVLPFLEREGVRVACINGRTSKMDKTRIKNEFAEDKYDIIITSVTRGLDLDADYLIFYEFTTDIKQMMGRAVRGLNPKTLDVYFIFTLKTGEIEYFKKYIYERSLSIQEVLKKDYSELVRVGQMLSSYY